MLFSTGGNAARDKLSAVHLPSLSLLTTHFRPGDRLLTTTGMTSAATSLASRMAAQIMAEYPDLWPETVRALIVHSARWTSEMESMHLPRIGRPNNKSGYALLLRCCGFGVPDRDRALWSVANSLTMIVQQDLTPFMKDSSNRIKTSDMHLHDLPWPIEALQSLGGTPVELRITLSYFIEPNPTQRGTRSRYRYESHGLRFDVRRPFETVDEFRRRINAAAGSEANRNDQSGDDPNLLIGSQNRHKGSLHQDVWRGTAADLASRDSIAIYPSAGWWKSRRALGRYESKARYALVVSILAPEVNVNLYAEVANQIESLVPTEVEI